MPSISMRRATNVKTSTEARSSQCASSTTRTSGVLAARVGERTQGRQPDQEHVRGVALDDAERDVQRLALRVPAARPGRRGMAAAADGAHRRRSRASDWVPVVVTTVAPRTRARVHGCRRAVPTSRFLPRHARPARRRGSRSGRPGDEQLELLFTPDQRAPRRPALTTSRHHPSSASSRTALAPGTLPRTDSARAQASEQRPRPCDAATSRQGRARTQSVDVGDASSRIPTVERTAQPRFHPHRQTRFSGGKR